MSYIIGYVIGIAIAVFGVWLHLLHKVEIPAYLIILVAAIIAAYNGFMIKAYLYANVFDKVLN